jgi:hypothetical protein
MGELCIFDCLEMSEFATTSRRTTASVMTVAHAHCNHCRALHAHIARLEEIIYEADLELFESVHNTEEEDSAMDSTTAPSSSVVQVITRAFTLVYHVS